jgi:hypothetical protein
MAKSGRKPTHGMRYTKEYCAWIHMKQRCLNPKHKRYADYGGRGITICERWMNFENFFSDMGFAPNRKLSLERIRNDEGYKPDNCKWATAKEQVANRRGIIKHEYSGECLTISEWAKVLDVNKTVISKRVKKGISIADIFNNPPSRKPSRRKAA